MQTWISPPHWFLTTKPPVSFCIHKSLTYFLFQISWAHLNNILVTPKVRLLSYGCYFKFTSSLKKSACFSFTETWQLLTTYPGLHFVSVNCYVNGHKKIYYSFWISLVITEEWSWAMKGVSTYNLQSNSPKKHSKYPVYSEGISLVQWEV